jgi:serine O-acetyltransferase
MINSKKDLNEYIQADRNYYNPTDLKTKFISSFSKQPLWEIRRYMTYLRKLEYYINTANGNFFKKLAALYYERKKNKLGTRLGIEISPNCFGKGLIIYHIGSIIINANVKAGDYCRLHGDNCIGYNGKSDIAPKLGNNVDIGYGAVIIGDVYIADNCTIGANAVVTRSFDTCNDVIVGVPAKSKNTL